MKFPCTERLRITAGLFLLLLMAATACGQPYNDARLPIETRVQDLLDRMSPEEKFWQLFMLAADLDGGVAKYRSGVFSFQIPASYDSAHTIAMVNAMQRHFVDSTRLGIPIIPFCEALHGAVLKGVTSFPQAIALAATFDTSLMHQVSAAIARDCRSRGIRQVLSPVVNIAGDVRWGRVEETYGEDPCLASEMGVAFVSEFERRGVITTPKHFIANVGDGGRDSYPIQLNERLIREIHLPPFAACITRGGSRSVMTSYNSYDGTPCSANEWLNKTVLKHELGFDGYIISDAGAVGGANVLHFTSKDYAESGELAIKGGLDVIFQTSFDHYSLFSPPFLDGRIPADMIDSAVARVLRAKFELGLFENPYDPNTSDKPGEPDLSPRQLAHRASQESIVLLKNDQKTLPLSKKLKSIAVIGPDASDVRLGGYSSPGNDPVSILEGIRRRVGTSANVQYARGCPRVEVDYVTVPADYLSCTLNDTVKNGLLGSYFDNVTLSGIPVLSRVDRQIQFQWTLFSPDPAMLPYDFYSVRWTGKLKGPGTGVYRIGIDGNDGYRLYLNDSLLIDNWHKISRRTLVTDYHFEKEKLYDIRIEFFEPSGNAWFRLVWNAGIPPQSDSAMAEAVALAARSDVAIVVVGIEEGEFRDRAYLALPGRQEELIKRVAATGKPVVVILVGGSAIVMNSWLADIPAVLDVWYPGEAGGDAVADILLGDYSPAGRLPITFPVAEGQLPLVYNHKPTGRGDDYADLTGQPLFPFGYGLSYTTFEYTDLSLDHNRISPADSSVITCRVKNTGSVAGDEVVQLYIRDQFASVARPITELKGFRRIHLQPGETQVVQFAVTPAMLSMLDKNLHTVVEPGDFTIMIGASSKDIRLRDVLTVGN